MLKKKNLSVVYNLFYPILGKKKNTPTLYILC
ncbi:MAG: hypothetical protein JWO58_254 [Chitinophagaceae bacterium]|nr:hypothetical protein [Chitinophagaceae bacterium]